MMTRALTITADCIDSIGMLLWLPFRLSAEGLRKMGGENVDA